MRSRPPCCICRATRPRSSPGRRCSSTAAGAWESKRAVASPSALSGRVALVTGGGRGIGREIALELARAGADVAVNYHDDPERAQATADEIATLGVRAMTVGADVGEAAAVHHMVEEVRAAFGSLDVLVNNAGVQTWTPFLDVTESE